MSVSIFAVTATKTWSPATIVRAEVPSCVRAIVNVSAAPGRAVARTISAFAFVGCVPTGHTTALNGTAGKFAPSPEATTRLVPLVAGLGAVATVLKAKFLWASIVTGIPPAGYCALAVS